MAEVLAVAASAAALEAGASAEVAPQEDGRLIFFV